MAGTPAKTEALDAPNDSETTPTDISGRSLGEFDLIRRIGVGGMGQVYLARQRSLKRQVAIKVLKPELAANTTALRRFQAEAEAVANITHANIVQVYAIGADEGLHYMALEFVDGRTLRDFLEKKGVPDLPVAVEIMRQVAAALGRAGELGFVHRDIKPENILLSKKGEVKVTDFGLSRCFSSDAPLHLTQSGVAMGTPLYMSPEQVRGLPVDPRSDLYSFGVTCYHMLGGEPPFRAAAAFDVALMHVQGEPKPLSSLRPDLPPDLCALVHKLMAKKPDDRYQSASEVLIDLARIQAGTGLASASSVGTSVMFPGLGNSSTMVSRVNGSGSLATQVIQPPIRWGRYLGLLLAIVVAGGAGTLAHRFLTPPPSPISHEEAVHDIDPDPSVIAEKEMRKQLADRSVKIDVAAERLLDLTELLIRERRLDDAMKLFESDLVKRFPAFEPSTGKETSREKNYLIMLRGLGKAIVLAHQDRADESNAEFLRVLNLMGASPVKDKLPKPKVGPVAPIDEFFYRTNAGGAWKRATNESLERNARNLKGVMPAELGRLRPVPTKLSPGKP